jgi:predicted signal transduction protein with EAL and GGDEF domain
VGAATYPAHGLDTTEMVAQANKSLSTAKTNGKNRIAVAKGRRGKQIDEKGGQDRIVGGDA